MDSLINLFKALLYFYLGFFTYITYQILFYHQKKFIFIKTIIFFFSLAIIIINISNKYNIDTFHMYIFIFILGIIIARKLLKKIILKTNTIFTINMKPIKKLLIKILKIIAIPSFYPIIKQLINKYKYYKIHPHHKPKTIYE